MKWGNNELAQVLEREDVGMREAGERLSLAQETGRHLLTRDELRQDGLDGHDAAKPCVPRSVDGAHAVLSERAQHLVAAGDDGGRDSVGDGGSLRCLSRFCLRKCGNPPA